MRGQAFDEQEAKADCGCPLYKTLKYMLDMMNKTGMKDELPDEMGELIRIIRINT